jgi:protein involved in polysaccharide export with SLBB domain
LGLRLVLGLLIAAGLAIAGCGSSDPMHVDKADVTASAAAAEQDSPQPDDPELDKLWSERTAQISSNDDYPIGPGDVLTITVPQVPEIQDLKVRVTTAGTFELPMVGAVQAGGLTEEQLEAALDQKLGTIMYSPQASVFVNEYHNREVAVIGAVNHPGLVTLESPDETILDALTQAGGLVSSAADELIMIPAQTGAGLNMAKQVSMVAYSAAPGAGEALPSAAGAEAGNGAPPPAGEIAPHQAGGEIPGGNAALNAHAQRIQAEQHASLEPDVAANALRLLPPNAHPLTIKIHSTSLSGAGKYINMPLRPGDVIVVPGGGNVMVVGWVQTPGYFSVGSGLTAMGAIGAAGGPMYAADTSDITLIRTAKDGSKKTIAINLGKITNGKEPDIPVKANDVIDVPYSNARIGPYIFYQILSRMGVMGPAVPF